MFLGYTDDSGTRDKKSPFQVVTTILVHDRLVRWIEAISGTLAQLLLPREKWDSFEEFKACEIYGGYGVFEGIEQAARFETIRKLLTFIGAKNIPVIYGAVRKDKLVSGLFGSADPVDVCFRICLNGVNSVLKRNFPDDLGLLIVDDFDKNIKQTCRQSFRTLRQKMACTTVYPDKDPFWNIHDDLYFGASKDSVGIQMADLCAFFIQQHLKVNDPVAETFYNLFEHCIVESRVEPEISQSDANAKSQTA